MRRWIWLVLAVVVAALAQDTGQKKDSSTQKKDQPAPLFGGKLGIRSSQNTKESATLGFNGIDPSGKVDEKMLATTPTAADQAKVKKMSEQVPSGPELAAFLKEGGLNA